MHEGKVGRVGRVAASAHDAGVAGVGHPRLDGILHPNLVVIGQDHDAALPTAPMGEDEFGDDREDLLRPSQDERVALLQHLAPSFAQLRDPPVDAAGDKPDERAADKDAEQHDEQRLKAQGPAHVGLHGRRLQGA